MNCSWSTVNLGWRAGNLVSMINEAKEISKLLNTRVSFEFNGLRVNLTQHSDTRTLVDKVEDGIEESKLSVFGEGWG